MTLHICEVTPVLSVTQFLKQILQLFEGECVPDIEKLKLELLKEEVGCVEYNCGLPTPQKITI